MVGKIMNNFHPRHILGPLWDSCLAMTSSKSSRTVDLNATHDTRDVAHHMGCVLTNLLQLARSNTENASTNMRLLGSRTTRSVTGAGSGQCANGRRTDCIFTVWQSFHVSLGHEQPARKRLHRLSPKVLALCPNLCTMPLQTRVLL